MKLAEMVALQTRLFRELSALWVDRVRNPETASWHGPIGVSVTKSVKWHSSEGIAYIYYQTHSGFPGIPELAQSDSKDGRKRLECGSASAARSVPVACGPRRGGTKRALGQGAAKEGALRGGGRGTVM